MKTKYLDEHADQQSKSIFTVVAGRRQRSFLKTTSFADISLMVDG
jgi:hypothetical protein